MAGFLVAVDFSELSERLIDRAVHLANASGHRIDLLHVLVGTIGAPVMGHPSANQLIDKVHQREEHQSKRRLAELMAQKVPEAMRGACLLREGAPAEAICEQAETGYDLVVISTNGRTGLRHMLLGSVAERVVRYSPVDVLVVR